MEYAKGVKGEIDQRPKRFYTHVSIARGDAGWGVALDNRPLRTPNGRMLILPTEKLANAIADEWRAQDERIDLQSMFNTRLAHTALDGAPEQRERMAGEAARYAETDLVCHLAERPAALRAQQDAGWGPLRVWAAEAHGVKLNAVAGIMPAVQPAASLEAVRGHAIGLEDFRLTGLVHGVALLGSAVLGLAVERGRISAAEAYELSRIDEAYQVSQWGEDAEAVRRTERHRAEARALDLWFGALA